MTIQTITRLTERFESHFGAPENGNNVFSFANALTSDTTSVFPAEVIAAIDGWGGAHWYVPRNLGGDLTSFDALFHFIRLMARRDLTVAIAHAKTFLGAVNVWVAGNPAQSSALAHRILRGEAVALALTEREHGSDISATTTLAAGLTTDEPGYVLNGEKYLINNATRSSVVNVFARTETSGGSRDFSLFMVEKDCLPPQQYTHLAKVLTHGIKGADISGIRFANAALAPESLIGEPGHGLEITLKGFQITRVLCTALSCGAGDTALRSAFRFARQRAVYGKTLLDLPVIQQRLSAACADLLIADAVGLVVSRAVTFMPQQMSVISAVAKAALPPRIELMIDSLVDVLGARAYLETGVETGVENPDENSGGISCFGKLQRDCRIVSIFDGNTVINWQALILQLPALARRRMRMGENVSGVGALFQIDATCPELTASAGSGFPELSLSSHGRDDIVATLRTAHDQLAVMANLTESVRVNVHQHISTACDSLTRIDRFVIDHPPNPQSIEKKYFDLAEEYGRLFCAACCLQLFFYSRPMLNSACQDGQWLAVCLARLITQLRTHDVKGDETMLAFLDASVTGSSLLSIFSIPLAPPLASQESI
ncbi:acyl-CoA dehydrogenase family protein [Glaciimonas sp. GG7]